MLEEIRKALKLGKATLAITLPREWVKSHNIKSGDSILIREEEDKLVLEKIRKSEIPPPVCIIRPEEYIELPGLLLRLIIGAYVYGYDIIYIPIKKEKFYVEKEVKKATNKLIGLYISEASDDNIILTVVTDPSRPDFNSSLMRLLIILNSLIDLSSKILLDEEKPDLEYINELSDEFDKTNLLALRQLLKSQYDRTLIKRIGLKSHLWLLGNRATLVILRSVSLNARELITLAKKLQDSIYLLSDEAKEFIFDICKKIKTISEETISSLLMIDPVKSNTLINDIDKITLDIEEYLDEVPNEKLGIQSKVALSCYLRVLENIIIQYKMINEIVINRSTGFTNKYVIIDEYA